MNFRSVKNLHRVLLFAVVLMTLSGCMTMMSKMAPSVDAEKNISADFPFDSKFVSVDGSKIHYVDVGSGIPVVFIHGNPTSSYLWRNVIPLVAKNHRAIALDLIGMGQSDKPKITYRLQDHIHYFDGFMKALNLEECIIVGHDWGGAIGIDYAMRHQQQVKGLVLMETLIRPMKWSEWDWAPKYMFKRFRDPEDGYKLIVKDNYFVNDMIPMMSGRKLSETEMDHYRAPFLREEDRTPVRTFPLEVPIDGEPHDNHERIQANYEALKSSSMPLLLLRGTPGAIIKDESYVESFRKDLPRMKVENIGPGIHYLQEAQPTNIGKAISRWIDEENIR